jgi:cyanophycinase-like exopeptidase
MRLALVGGEEFADGFEDVHAGLLAEVGKSTSRGVFLPTCAADDGPETVEYWCNLARQRLSAWGAQVESLRVVDRASAEDTTHAKLVAEADWIYLGGGQPHVAMRILANSNVLTALQEAATRGTLIIGASAGAMMMCERSFVITPELVAEISRILREGAPPDWNPPLPAPLDCLAFIPRSMCLPHFDRGLARGWIEGGLRPEGFTVIGVDEQTALVNTRGTWEVRGRGTVVLYRDGLAPERLTAGQTTAM